MASILLSRARDADGLTGFSYTQCASTVAASCAVGVNSIRQDLFQKWSDVQHTV